MDFKIHLEQYSATLFCCWFVVLSSISALHKHEHMPAKRLHHDLFVKKGYEKLIIPTGNKKVLHVQLSMRLTQILKIDEKNQIMTASIWLNHEWFDRRLAWDPDEYDGVRMLKIPSTDLWLPDIVLYNNADGDFAITLFTKATVYSDGIISWEPPAIVKSYCPIDVEFFPFDMQNCFLKFGTWSHNGNDVDLHHPCTYSQTTELNESLEIANGISLNGFYPNVEWDIINVTARRTVKKYICCPELYPDITYYITLRRRTLFYSVNLIVPCMAISCLCVLVFYLPSDSCEKITLSISILLALTVFFLLLADLIPPTSLVIPLIVKYLLFTSVLVTLSIVLTVFVLSIHHRTPSTHTMSPWVKRVFTEILPKVLLMRRPDMDRPSTIIAQEDCNGVDRDPSPIREIINAQRMNRTRKSDSGDESEAEGTSTRLHQTMQFSKAIQESFKSVDYICDRMKKNLSEEAEIRDWKYVAMVMDRLFLYIFTLACFLGATCIFLTAPSLYDPREPIVNNSVADCITQIVPSGYEAK